MVSKKELQNTIDRLRIQVDDLVAENKEREKQSEESRKMWEIVDHSMDRIYDSLKNSLKKIYEVLERNEQDIQKKDMMNQLIAYTNKSEEENLAGRLIHVGAFDVAKSYIDFLKDKAKKAEEKAKQHVTASPIGRKTVKKNNGADLNTDKKETDKDGKAVE